MKTVTLYLARSTAGTHVYSEPQGMARSQQTFPTIYVQRSALPAEPPAKIEVTINWEAK
jgi:hypothetical protein